jgi:probable addiction module antidote protein
MGKTKTSPFDAAEHLRTPKEMAAYLEVVFEESGDDAAIVADALKTVIRAQAMSQLARDAGLSRKRLYRALSGDRSPDFQTILKVIGALGLRLTAETVRS